MLRLAIAVAIIVAIFLHSPVRQPGSLSSEVAHLKERAESELMAAAARSPLAQSIAESALRRTLSDTTSLPLPRRDDHAAALPRP